MTRRVAVGPLSAIPADACVAVADGVAVAVRVGDRVCVYRNRCLHQESPLEGGWVRSGVLSCPRHFWRYDAATGRHLDGSGALERFDAEVIGDEVFVELPDDTGHHSLREELLARARHYDRDDAWRRWSER